MNTTPALSIRQPWAWLITHGHKDIENRNWKTNRRGKIFIHASKGMTKRDYDEAKLFVTPTGITLPPITQLERGGIVGSVEITGCVSQSDSFWFTGEWGFTLSNSEALPFEPCKGRLGFFKPSLQNNTNSQTTDYHAPSRQ